MYEPNNWHDWLLKHDFIPHTRNVFRKSYMDTEITIVELKEDNSAVWSVFMFENDCANLVLERKIDNPFTNSIDITV
jgi:hypothetical protein